MALNCGIIGLPNVGKSTIFKALTSAPVEIENYPFCTVSPNRGIVPIYDQRLVDIAQAVKSEKYQFATVEFVDIAGLVMGASKGEGLGNQFLGHIREVNALIHVVRCFEDDNIVHISGRIDPLADVETVNIELALADLETVEKRLNNVDKFLKSQDREIIKKTKISIPVLEKVRDVLSAGAAIRSLELSADEREIIDQLNLLTAKKVVYVCNMNEETFSTATDNRHFLNIKKLASREEAAVLPICGKIEAEVALLDSEQQKLEFLNSLNIDTLSLNRLLKHAYKMLGLNTFFTANEKEAHAWPFEVGIKAHKAAGLIHSDFEKGFIKAAVYNYNELMDFGCQHRVKEAGKLRIEGKDYLVHDGDIIYFRFNV